MNNTMRFSKAVFALLLIGALAGCVAASGPYYQVRENPTYTSSPGGGGGLYVGPSDRTYVLRVDDRTPFGVRALPRTRDLLYERGFDRVKRERKADFSINVSLSYNVGDNPEQRAVQTLGGAMIGAATGAIIGGAVGDPGAGAAIGAGSGAALGFVAPAGSHFVTVNVTVYSFNERSSSQASRTIDLTNAAPPDAHFIIDSEVSRMLQVLSAR